MNQWKRTLQNGNSYQLNTGKNSFHGEQDYLSISDFAQHDSLDGEPQTEWLLFFVEKCLSEVSEVW